MIGSVERQRQKKAPQGFSSVDRVKKAEGRYPLLRRPHKARAARLRPTNNHKPLAQTTRILPSIDTNPYTLYNGSVKQGFLVSTKRRNVLEDFKLFYEELSSSASIDRLRRPRTAIK